MAKFFKRFNFFVIIFWLGLFQLAVIIINERSLLPGLEQIVANTFKLFSDVTFWDTHIYSSFKRLISAACIAVPAAYLLALISIKNKYLNALINSFVSATFPLPKVALLPFFLLIFGIGDAGKIALIATSMFYLMFVSVHEGLAELSSSYYQSVTVVYKLKSFDYWYSFLFKGSLSYFLVGLKSAINYGLTMIVVSEYSLSQNGLGFFIWSSWDQFRVHDMYSGLLILCMVGFSLNQACAYLAQRHRITYGLK